MLDSGYDIDIDAVIENVAEAEVVTFYFPVLRRTLLVDTRLDGSGSPLVSVVPMVSNTQERFDSLREMRPSLPRPESITMIQWTRRVESLCGAGVWDGLVRRLDQLGSATAIEAAQGCLDELRAAERDELSNVIKGVGYHTMWGGAPR